MSFEETSRLIEEVRKLSADQRGTYVAWLVIDLIRDISYWAVIGILAYALGRRIIQAILIAVRESKRA